MYQSPSRVVAGNIRTSPVRVVGGASLSPSRRVVGATGIGGVTMSPSRRVVGGTNIGVTRGASLSPSRRVVGGNIVNHNVHYGGAHVVQQAHPHVAYTHSQPVVSSRIVESSQNIQNAIVLQS